MFVGTLATSIPLKTTRSRPYKIRTIRWTEVDQHKGEEEGIGKELRALVPVVLQNEKYELKSLLIDLGLQKKQLILGLKWLSLSRRQSRTPGRSSNRRSMQGRR
jgi:hypothetical protein